MDDQAVLLAFGMGIGCVLVLIYRAYDRRQAANEVRKAMEKNPIFAEEMTKVLRERGGQ